MTPAIGYIRVSTEGQADNGLSLDGQREAIKAHCLTGGLDLLEIYADEGVSGCISDRPGLQDALAHVEGLNGAALVVYSLSRLSRRLVDQLGFIGRVQACGGEVVSLSEDVDTTSPSGILLLQILGALNEYQRNNASKTTHDTMQTMRRGIRRGDAGLIKRFSNLAPYGYKLGKEPGTLEPVIEEQRAIALVRDLYEAGLDMGEIRRALSDAGHEPRTGTWRSITIRRILEREGLLQKTWRG
jgi:DNA invertase Pin-like site-specific DNA recombinase